MANGSEQRGEVGYGTRLHQNLGALAGLVEGFRPELFSGSDACRLTEMFAWGERLCATGKALAAKRVVDTGAWEPSGERSGADWLGRVSGQTAGQAAATLETVRRMGDQPQVEEAARAGTLSPEQGSAITAAVKQAPEKTGELLYQARSDNLAALRERSKEIKWAADEKTEKDRDRRIHAGRYLRSWTDPDGSGRLTGRFTPEALAVVESALQPFHDEVFTAARRAGTRERPECHHADALVAMARGATGQDDSPDPIPANHDPATYETDGGDDRGASDRSGPNVASDQMPASQRGDRRGGNLGVDGVDGVDTRPGGSTDNGVDGPSGPALPRPAGATPISAGARPISAGASPISAGATPHPDGGSRGGGGGSSPGARAGPPLMSAMKGGGIRTRRPAMVIVRIDHAALVRGYRQADECCEIDGIGLVSVATVRAMMTDAFLAAVVTDGIDIRSVVHLGRTVTATQRTALLARDPECVIPGCHIRSGLEIDHVADWAATKVTTLDGLARLCAHHHHQKTRDGWQLQGRPGRWQWIAPHPTDPDPPPDAPHPTDRDQAPGRPKPPGPPTPHQPPPSPAGPDERPDPPVPTTTRSLSDSNEEPCPP